MSSETSTPETPTTTHDAWGAGEPHLRITRDGERLMYPLEADSVRIGSAEGVELRLDGADPVHATIDHDERDEYVLTLHGEGETNAASVDEQGRRTQILRTGAHFTIGEWTLVFGRAESADHGRPFGGRAGGELSDQPLQPPRPDYSDEAAEAAEAKEGSDAAASDGSEDPDVANVSGQGGSADGAHRSSTTERLAGDKQGATAPDDNGDPEEPWS